MSIWRSIQRKSRKCISQLEIRAAIFVDVSEWKHVLRTCFIHSAAKGTIFVDGSDRKMLSTWFNFSHVYKRSMDFDETCQESSSQRPVCVLVFGRIVQQSWPSWPLFGWDIFNFSSAFTEQIWWNLKGSKYIQRPLPSLCLSPTRQTLQPLNIIL